MNFIKAMKRAGNKAQAAGQPVTVFNNRPEPVPGAQAYNYTTDPEKIAGQAVIVATIDPATRRDRKRKRGRRK